jgi:hypothetical protein
MASEQVDSTELAAAIHRAVRVREKAARTRATASVRREACNALVGPMRETLERALGASEEMGRMRADARRIQDSEAARHS